MCKQFKVSRDRYSSLLNFFSILNKFWIDIIMNFVTKLSTNNECNVILIIINKLIKMRYYILHTKKNIFVEKTTHLLINHVWKLHDLSDIIMFDKEFQFISLIWKSLCQALRIIIKLSIAFYFETNNQSEIINQKIKRYLRNYYNY